MFIKNNPDKKFVGFFSSIIRIAEITTGTVANYPNPASKIGRKCPVVVSLIEETLERLRNFKKSRPNEEEATAEVKSRGGAMRFRACLVNSRRGVNSKEFLEERGRRKSPSGCFGKGACACSHASPPPPPPASCSLKPAPHSQRDAAPLPGCRQSGNVSTGT